jgi:hypothetical protein
MLGVRELARVFARIVALAAALCTFPQASHAQAGLPDVRIGFKVIDGAIHLDVFADSAFTIDPAALHFTLLPDAIFVVGQVQGRSRGRLSPAGRSSAVTRYGCAAATAAYAASPRPAPSQRKAIPNGLLKPVAAPLMVWSGVTLPFAPAAKTTTLLFPEHAT